MQPAPSCGWVAKWHVVMPLITILFGYFPGKRLGWLEDTPKGVVWDWIFSGERFEDTWRGRSSARYSEKRALVQRFAAVTAPTLAVSVTDDEFGTVPAVERLLAQGGCWSSSSSSKAGHDVVFLTRIAIRMNNALPIECMKPDYKAVLYAVQKRDKALWDLGDALVAECGAPDPTSAGYAGPGRLRAAWHYLQENGCDYSIAELSKLRRVAYVFGQSTRRFDISLELYAEAGTPEMLEAIIGGMPKGTLLTKSYIASIRKQWKRHQREEAKE